MNVNEILKKSRKQTNGFLVTNKGTKKESIYKESIFDGLNDKEKKSSRKKIRNYVHSIFESIINAEQNKNTANIAKLAKDFSEFYKETYKVNDYSFASVASENTKDKETINKALNIIKKSLKIK
jgi:hypothetical protein